MKEYLKMSDVFDGEVVANHGCEFNGWSAVETSLGLSIDESGDGGFNEKTADYVAHAINSHDELVQMSKELLAALESVGVHTITDEDGDEVEVLFGDMDRIQDAIYKAKGGEA